MNNSTRSDFVRLSPGDGSCSFVGSENSIVIVSLSPYTASLPNGSFAVTDSMNGPIKVPKVPESTGDIAFEGSDVSSTFLILPDSLAIIRNSPILGGSSTRLVSIVITNV